MLRLACQAPLPIEFSRSEYWSGAIPFSKGSLQLRDQTQVSHIEGRIFIIWATRKDQLLPYNPAIVILGICP